MFMHLNCKDKIGDLEGNSCLQVGSVFLLLLVWYSHVHIEILSELYPSSLGVAIDPGLDFHCL